VVPRARLLSFTSFPPPCEDGNSLEVTASNLQLRQIKKPLADSVEMPSPSRSVCNRIYTAVVPLASGKLILIYNSENQIEI